MTLSREQRYAFEQFKQKKNLFITGPGGTGKTFLIQTLVDHMNAHNIKYQVCALTGCAAMLLHHCNARTLHSWSGIRMARGSPQQVLHRVAGNKFAKSNWKGVQVLIVDEVSMMSRRIFDIVNDVGRMFRSSQKPFGGIQVIFTGDFYQLPPVGDADVAHSSDFCFQSDKWHTVFPPENHIQLVTPFRQKDPEYSAILDEVRRGELSEHGIGALRLRVREYVDDGGIAPTQLYAIRVKTDFVNNKMYGALKTAEIVCETVPNANARLYIENGEPLEPSVLDACLSLTEDDRKFYFEMLHTNSNTTKRMALKIGAVVMCTVNLNLEMGICNGSQGVVEEFVKDLTNRSVPMVRFNNGVRMQIGYHKVQSHDYPTLTLEYMPLVLAWALTIHKIQGSTLDRAIMDLGTTVFEYGQTYVALSRVRSIDGLYLKAFVPQRIKSNPLVKEFYSKIPALPIEVTHESMEEVEEMVVNLSLAPSVPVPPAPPVPGPTLAPLVPTAHSVMPKAPSSVIPSRFSAFAYNAPPIQVTKLPEEAPAPLVEEPPKAEEPTSSGSTECSICLTNKKNVLYMPCNHICVCNACDEQLARDMIVKEKKYRMCPLCRKKIVSKMNVFV